jgi:hypothetical protein
MTTVHRFKGSEVQRLYIHHHTPFENVLFGKSHHFRIPTNPEHGSWQLYIKTSIYLGLRVFNSGIVPNPEP